MMSVNNRHVRNTDFQWSPRQHLQQSPIPSIRYRRLHQTSLAIKKLTLIILYENNLKRVSRLLAACSDTLDDCALQYREGGVSFLDAQAFLFQDTVVMCSSRCSWTTQGSGASLTYTELSGSVLCGYCLTPEY